MSFRKPKAPVVEVKAETPPTIDAIPKKQIVPEFIKIEKIEKLFGFLNYGEFLCVLLEDNIKRSFLMYLVLK